MGYMLAKAEVITVTVDILSRLLVDVAYMLEQFDIPFFDMDIGILK